MPKKLLKTDFVYGNWKLKDGESLTIDPASQTLDDPTEDGYIGNDGYWRAETGDYLEMGSYEGWFRRAYVEWDVSSISGTITDTIFKYHGSVNTIDCHIHEMLGCQPSVTPDNAAGNQLIFDEAGEGTVYADPVGFPIPGINQQVDLGAAADSDLQSQLALDWFAIGIQSDDEGAYGKESFINSEEKAGVTPPPTLYIEYSVGWMGKISGITNPAKILGIPVTDIAKVKGIA